MNKIDSLGKFQIPRFGGVVLIFAYIFAVCMSLVIRMIFQLDSLDMTVLYPALLSILLMSFIGYIDDTMIFTHRPIKPILGILAAIPMMSVNYDNAIIHLGLFAGGNINLGILFPILFVPVFISLVANLFNIMADFDGLVPGNGLLIAFSMAVIFLVSGKLTAFFILLPVIGGLIVLWKFNKFPASIFAGETGTLGIGVILAVVAVVAERKIPLLIMFIPYIFHLFLQCRYPWDKKKLLVRPRERGIPQPDGTIKSEYSSSYGLTHLLMRHIPKLTEKKLTYCLAGIEIPFILLALYTELPHLFFIMQHGYSSLVLK